MICIVNTCSALEQEVADANSFSSSSGKNAFMQACTLSHIIDQTSQLPNQAHPDDTLAQQTNSMMTGWLSAHSVSIQWASSIHLCAGTDAKYGSFESRPSGQGFTANPQNFVVGRNHHVMTHIMRI
jgi:hypothetical protein